MIDRRTMVAGVTALTLSGSALAADPPRRRIGYALVGLGSYAARIAAQFAHCTHSRIAALVSGDRAKALEWARRYDVPERAIHDYASFDRIADDPDIDAVYVLLPVSMHAEYTIRAAKAGKHVMCEKPMAVSSAECEAMIAACKRAGRKLMIGYRSRFEPHNREAIRLARSGALGRIRYFRSEHGFVAREPDAWRMKKAMSGGGSLMDIGIYALNAARYLTGEEPAAVSAFESTDRRDPRFREVEDMIAWTMEFPSGALAGCQTMYSANQNRIFLAGDEGRLEMEPATQYEGNRLWTGGGGRDREVTPPPGPRPTQFAGQIDHFSDCILTGATPIVPGEEGLRDIRLIEAIYRAARTGQRVSV